MNFLKKCGNFYNFMSLSIMSLCNHVIKSLGQQEAKAALTFGYPSLPFLEFVHKLTNTLGLLLHPKVEDLFCKQYFFPHFGKGGVRKSVHISTFLRTLP